MSSNQWTKVNVSDEHRHMIRLYMVHHRLPTMQEAAARMIETAMAAEEPYSYKMPKELAASRGRVEALRRDNPRIDAQSHRHGRRPVPQAAPSEG